MAGVTTVNKRELIKYISAFTMGDGGVYYSGNNCRFICNQIAVNRDYIEWRADILSNLTKVNIFESIQDNKQPILCTQTRTHPIYTKIRERLYIDNYKSIDPHYLTNLDWEMLAILYQDDGSYYFDTRSKGSKPNIYLHLKRLSYGDQLLLKNSLKEKLDLEFNINRHYNRYFLRLRSNYTEYFIANIAKYIFPSFYYKLGYSDILAPVKDDDTV